MKYHYINISPPYTLNKDWDASEPQLPSGVFQELKNYRPEKESLETRKGITEFAFTASVTAAPSGNDFSGDANCVSVWNLENNGNDSKGGNHLTMTGGVTYDNADYKQGSYSAVFEKASSQYGIRDDGDLDAGTPGKSGESETAFSVTGWIKPVTLGNWSGILDKFNELLDQRSWLVMYNGSSNVISLYIGYNNGVDKTALHHGTSMSINTWYHMGCVYNAADNSMKIRMHTEAALMGVNATGTAGGNMSPDASPIYMGRHVTSAGTTSDLDAKLDEVVLFKDVLTDGEIDQIWAGTYGS